MPLTATIGSEGGQQKKRGDQAAKAYGLFTPFLELYYAGTIDSGGVELPPRIRTASAATAGVGSVLLIVWAPALVSFALAAAGAASWCFWLERHPTA